MVSRMAEVATAQVVVLLVVPYRSTTPLPRRLQTPPTTTLFEQARKQRQTPSGRCWWTG